MSNNPINVLFFASIKQQTGESKITLSIPENLIIKDLKEILSIRYPALGSSFQTALFAVNKEFAFDCHLSFAWYEIIIKGKLFIDSK